jgi:hypothetical protein
MSSLRLGVNNFNDLSKDEFGKGLHCYLGATQQYPRIVIYLAHFLSQFLNITIINYRHLYIH